MKVNLILLFLSLVLYTSGAHAHTFTGMVGFYDGLSHPVLGIDHFLAMVSVGIVSKNWRKSNLDNSCNLCLNDDYRWHHWHVD